MNRRTPLIANEGMVYTNGEMYGAIIYPADGIDVSRFYQITKEEYNKIKEKQEAEMNLFHGA